MGVGAGEPAGSLSLRFWIQDFVLTSRVNSKVPFCKEGAVSAYNPPPVPPRDSLRSFPFGGIQD